MQGRFGTAYVVIEVPQQVFCGRKIPTRIRSEINHRFFDNRRDLYAVFEDKAVEKANGFFTDAALDRYWQDMPDQERNNVLQLMKKESFEIIYPVNGGYVAPQLLPKIRPDFAWDGQAAFRALRSELTAFAKGKKTIRGLFVEE